MSSETLVLVHMLSRHGDRSPITFSLYPNDPHKDKSFHPHGPGMLTNIGKKRMHTLGQQYRERYNNYLGELYLPEYIDTLSTEVLRARMSGQLFLSGLFPPSDELKWHDDLDWHPIPVNYTPVAQDNIMFGVTKPNFSEAYNKLQASDYGKAILNKYKDVIPFIKEHSGLKEIHIYSLSLFSDCLKVELEQGLSIPEWTKDVYPDALTSSFSDEVSMHTGTKELRRIVCGELFKKILSDSQKKIDNNSKYKMHLYFGHDINIAHVLIILGLWYSHSPSYCASLVFELHKIDDKYGFKIFYKKSPDEDFDLMSFDKGEDILWIEDFEEIVNDMHSDDDN